MTPSSCLWWQQRHDCSTPSVTSSTRATYKVDALVERVHAREAGSPFRIVVVGAGAGGVELAFTLWQRLKAADDPAIHVTLVHPLDDVLAGYPSSLIARVHENATRRNIEIVRHRRGAEARAREVLFEDGDPMPYGALLWVTGAVSHPIFIDLAQAQV